MKEIGVSLNSQKPAKAQALQVIKQLQDKSSLPIERAKVFYCIQFIDLFSLINGFGMCAERVLQMRLLVTVDAAKWDNVAQYASHVEETREEGANKLVTLLMEPSKFREMDNAVKEAGGKLDIVVHCVKPEADEKL